MPQHKSTRKRVRTSAKEQARNRAVRSRVRLAVRLYLEADAKEKAELLPATVSAIDTAVRRGVFKENTAKRMKSRLQQQLNRLQQPSN